MDAYRAKSSPSVADSAALPRSQSPRTSLTIGIELGQQPPLKQAGSAGADEGSSDATPGSEPSHAELGAGWACAMEGHPFDARNFDHAFLRRVVQILLESEHFGLLLRTIRFLFFYLSDFGPIERWVRFFFEISVFLFSFFCVRLSQSVRVDFVA